MHTNRLGVKLMDRLVKLKFFLEKKNQIKC